MSKTYQEKLRDPRWQKKRLDILNRDNWRCQDCDSTTAELQVHHCAYTGLEPWDVPDDLLLTMCDTCHEKRQNLENGIRVALGRITARVPIVRLEHITWNLIAEAQKDIEP